MNLTLNLLESEFAVCQLERSASIPTWGTDGEFFAVTRTADELSIVCETRLVPAGIRCEDHWRALKVAGPLDFSLVGILASLASTLAQTGVSIFAISTFDTDYLLVKSDRLDDAITSLKDAGHEIFVE